MNRQIALAYAISGLSTAIATVVVIATTVGFDPPPAVVAPSGDLLAQADDAPAPVVSAPAAAPAPVAARPAEPVPGAPPPVVEEVVYVDETGAPLLGPLTTRDDDEDDGHEAEHEDEDDDDDDERHGRRRAHRHDHDDD